MVEKLKGLLADCKNELEVAESVDFTEDIRKKVCAYEAELRATYEAKKAEAVSDLKQEIRVIEKLIAKEEAKAPVNAVDNTADNAATFRVR